jgi:hypothetical protein
MQVEKDFEDFVRLLNLNDVEYLIIGGFALAYHGTPRFTGDVDIYYGLTEINIEKILKVLQEFGFSSIDIKKNDLLSKGTIIQLGFEPVRIDLINQIDGVEFEDAYNKRVIDKFGNIETNYISYDFLVINKKASARPKDIADVNDFKKLRKKNL